VKKYFVISFTALSLIALSGCGGAATPSGSSTVSSTASPTHLEKNYLTGLPGINSRVLAVKIDDTRQAHPQIGLEFADVVYVEQVEGGLTRLAAIFTQQLPTTVGPVRSARISDLDILAQYGRVGFAFSGAQSKFYPKITAANLVNLSADRNSSQIYFRDSSRSAPTNLILRASDLMDKALNKDNAQIDVIKPIGFTFGAVGNFGTAITGVKVKWPAADYEATWSASESRWLLSHDGHQDLAASGKVLGSPTIIIQNVSITNSEYRDREGGITPFSNTVGIGTGYLLRDGKAIPINWNRPSATSGTTWTLADGSAANLNPGQIWVMLTDQEPTFSYPVSASAKASPTK
jgi:hypothetical protein